MPTSVNKKLEDMTIEELKQEIEYWDTKINGATQWGAAVGVAYEFKKDAERQLRRREAHG